MLVGTRSKRALAHSNTIWNIIMLKFYFLVIIISFIGCNERNNFSEQQIKKFNREILEGYNSKSEWVTSPLKIAVELCKPGEVSNKTEIEITKINKGERPTEVNIYIRESGVLDDSSSFSECFFHFKLENNIWTIK